MLSDLGACAVLNLESQYWPVFLYTSRYAFYPDRRQYRQISPGTIFLNCLYVRIDTDLKICIRHEAEDVDLLSVGAISISWSYHLTKQPKIFNWIITGL